VIGQSISVGSNTFRIIEACVASGAFYLLWILTFLTRHMTWNTRLKLLATCWAALLLVNVLRIVLLIVIAQEIGWHAFDAVHLLLWKFVSGIFVAVIWIAAVSYYKIKSVPIYDDFLWLYEQSTLSFQKSNKNVFKGKQGHKTKGGP
jgi:exosortase/archaeosortase family protein